MGMQLPSNKSHADCTGNYGETPVSRTFHPALVFPCRSLVHNSGGVIDTMIQNYMHRVLNENLSNYGERKWQ